MHPMEETGPRRRKAILLVLLSAALVYTLKLTWQPLWARFSGSNAAPAGWSIVEPVRDDAGWCPVPDRFESPADGLTASSELFGSDDARNRQVERLAAAVNAPTVSYDDNGDVDTDARWRAFGDFHAVLEKLFPQVHSRLRLEKINTYGLLYYLEGSDPTLQPILLMAHQDTVPPGDASLWTYPPFEAHWDGEHLWGRGAADCKSNLIGILSAMEALVLQDFRPRRSILLSFGFDEETGGFRGAAKLGAHLERQLGPGGLAFIMDEGGMGVSLLGDVAYALPAVAEKGFVDLVLNLTTSGGHSSRPPRHTAIGIMADILLTLEDHPFTPRLDDTSPVRQVLQCEADFSPGFVEPWLRAELASGKDFGPKIAQARGDALRWQIQTSQAIDVIRGGDKDNQLPSRVDVTINYRVHPRDAVDHVMAQVAEWVAMVAAEHNLSVRGLGYERVGGRGGELHLATQDVLAPSPVTPTDAASGVWRLFAATLRQVFESTPGVATAVPVGSIATGNSDTAHYWSLTDNIFRFTPARAGARLGVHDVDERMEMRAHMEGVRVYYDLVRNFQTYDGHGCGHACPSPLSSA